MPPNKLRAWRTGAGLIGDAGNPHPWGETRAALVNGLVMSAVIGAAIVAIV